jgi:hypothetical protein
MAFSKRALMAALLGAAAVGGLVWAAYEGPAGAADHLDPSGNSMPMQGPRVMLGDADDIADIYAWHTAEGNMVVALDFAGPNMPGTPATFSRDVLYGIHIDGNDEGYADDRVIYTRFGQNASSAWGVWVTGLPGGGSSVVGATETTITAGSARVFAGLRDDPFFFDLQGFRETAMMGTLRFDNTRDFFAGKNITSIVVEFPISEIGFDGPYNVWATTATIGG